jgi:hypothetical protein
MTSIRVWTTGGPGSGRASLAVKNLEMEDYFNILNALQDGASNSITVSLEVNWAPGVKHFKVRDKDAGMAGDFITNTATMVWSTESNGGCVPVRSDRNLGEHFRSNRTRT